MARIPPYTQMTLKYLRNEGYVAAVVEKWVSRGQAQQGWEGGNSEKPLRGFRQDLFGFIDIIAIDHMFTIAVQSTSGAQLGKHREKIMDNIEARAWLASSSRRIWLVTWTKKLVKRGGKAKRWCARITELRRADLGLIEAPF